MFTYTSGNLWSSKSSDFNRKYHTLNISHESLITRIILETIMLARNATKSM